MHEHSVARHLLDVVEEHAREAGTERVVAVNLKMGEHSHIDGEILQFHFDALTAGTESPAEGARLRLQRVPMRFRCQDCHREYTPEGGDFHCPHCGATGELLDVGDELTVESIEVEP